MKIAVAMSGGVDSSVSAALLKEAGHEITGVYMQGWVPEGFVCTAAEDRKDAMTVASELGIPFHTLDLSEVYKREVVEYLLAEYAAGATPNPDIMCNRYVKFGAFAEFAFSHGFDAIATGHYAQVQNTSDGKDAQLLMAVDGAKDQTYFLWAIPQAVLNRTLFPVGGYTKPQVRMMAQERNIFTAHKKDSQGVCFLGKIDMSAFLETAIPRKQGVVLAIDGSHIGTHQGAAFVTEGQRHGFTLTTTSPNQLPQYVVAKDIAENTITVASDPGALAPETATGQIIQIGTPNWLAHPPQVGTLLTARTRYRQPLQSARIVSCTDATFEIEIRNAAIPIARGQSLVLYNGTQCIGGGTIIGRTAFV
jgi:tRNA-specific 2-thiouridylase